MIYIYLHYPFMVKLGVVHLFVSIYYWLTSYGDILRGFNGYRMGYNYITSTLVELQ